ncbi:MAG: hypothetical protein ACRDJP_12980, partial [Actinomycetota bacterium]
TQARARATPAWPGGFVTSFPNLLLPFVIGEEAPPYPAAAEAKHPDQVDAEFGGGVATAHAGRDHVESRATVQHPSAPSEQEGVISAGNVRTITRQEWEGDALVTRAESITNDITILDQIRIGSVKVVAVARSSPSAAPTTDTSVSVSGVTVAGVPAVIDEDGISIAGQGDDDAILGGGGAVAEQAAAFLAELGHDVDIRLVGATETVEGAKATADATGLLISLTFEIISPTGDPLPGDDVVLSLANLAFEALPDDIPKPIPPGPNTIFRKYFTTVTIGRAMATSLATGSPAADDGTVDLGTLPPTDLPGAPGAPSASAPGSSEAGGSGPVDDVASPTGGDPGEGGTGEADPDAPARRAGPFGDPLLLGSTPADRLTAVVGVLLGLGGLLFGCARVLAGRVSDS